MAETRLREKRRARQRERRKLQGTGCQEDKSSQNGFPSLLTFVPINIDQKEAKDTKIKII